MRYLWVIVLLILFAFIGCKDREWEGTWVIVEKETIEIHGFDGHVKYHIVGLRDGKRELIDTRYSYKEEIYYAREINDTLTIRYRKDFDGVSRITEWWIE